MDEQFATDLRAIRKRVTARKLTEKSVMSTVREAVVGLQKDLAGAVGKELQRMEGASSGTVRGLLGRQTAALSQARWALGAGRASGGRWPG